MVFVATLKVFYFAFTKLEIYNNFKRKKRILVQHPKNRATISTYIRNTWKRYGRKTSRDRHDFFLSSPEISHSGLAPVPYSPFCRPHPRHFHPRVATPSDQLARRQLRGKPISALAATARPIRTPGSYGSANQNAWQLWLGQSERAI